MPADADHYDVIVVGAGSSGCALAARLSEDPGRRVLLLEAGPRYVGWAHLPPELRFAGLLSMLRSGNPHNWHFTAELRDGVLQPLPRGKVVGGSSAINGGLFTRGLPQDFDEWAAAGSPAWSFQQVLPHFKRLESDLDIRDEFHGSDGPIQVRREPEASWPAVARAFVDACRSAGYPYDPDMNGPASIGVGALPVNVVDGVRVNAGNAYLDPLVGRPNLVVRSDAPVRRVVMTGTRAVGVEIGGAHHPAEIVTGGEVVLSAGAVKSPQLLQLSGIGPSEELGRLGIPVLVESPAVGKHFTDHCSLRLAFRTSPERLDPTSSALMQTGLHYTSSEGIHSDMAITATVIPLNRALLYKASPLDRFRTLQSALGAMSARKLYEQVRYGWAQSLGCLLMAGASRGEVTLTSADPSAKPTLRYNYLTEEVDRRRMREALRLAAGLLDHPSYRDIGATLLTPDDGVLGSDDALDRYMEQHVGTAIHMSSSCRMGTDAADAVVDQYCRVHGAEGLRVVDTSIMPKVVRRCPNATAVMIGERAAEFF